LAGIKIKSITPLLDFEDYLARDWTIGSTYNSDDFVFYDDSGSATLRLTQEAPADLVQLTGDGVWVNGATGPGPSLFVSGRQSSQSVVRAANTASGEALRTIFSIQNFGPPSFTLIDDSPNGADWFFRSSLAGAFSIASNAVPVNAMILDPSGNMTLAGSLTQASSAAVKHDAAGVDAASVLAGVRSLDISTWSYDNAPGVKHMGPMSEDFFDAFGLGHTAAGIGAIDADGVALAAIQALAAENAELADRNAQLEAAMADLGTRLTALEALLGGWRTRTSPGTARSVVTPDGWPVR
jgi:hypothetical protein